MKKKPKLSARNLRQKPRFHGGSSILRVKELLTTLVSSLLLGSGLLSATPLGTAFTYQGRLDQNGQPANGSYTMRFALYDAPAPGGNLVNGTNLLNVTVANGLFAADLDFGPNAFAGQGRWLEIAVSTDNAVSFSTLLPRTRIAPTPNAIYASVAGTVSNGAIQIGQLATVGPAPGPGQVLGYNGSSLVWQTAGSSSSPWLLNGPNTYFGGGNVGIRTTTPTSALDVNGDGTFRNDLFVTRDLRLSGATSEAALGILALSGWAPEGLQPPTRFIVRREGTVGIGTGTPQAALDVRGNWDGGRPALQLGGQKPTIKFAPEPASGNHTWLVHLGSDGPGNLAFMHLSGFVYDSVLSLSPNSNVGIGTTSPEAKLDVRGTTRTCVLEITGGCDLVEPFLMKEETIEKGSVVVIDDEHPGRLKRSTQAYDTRVAGIVSGANGINPGIALKQEGVLDQGENVALTGRVYVQADASFGAIKPGDLLTTSNTPGHAMKVTDYARAQGAILGKAMSELTSDKGLVLVLVTLQ